MSADPTTVPPPYIVSPTDSWDGDDGNWNTFAIEVGTPPQSFRVLPSTVGEEIWLPTTEGCVGVLDVLSDCGDLRGVNDYNDEPSRGFQRDNSSTWNPLAFYQLDTQQNLFNNSYDQGYYGQDTVALGTPSASSGYGEEIPKQVIAAIATEDFWLGTLGLGTYAFSESKPGLLTSMKAQNLTTSLSYGYTAGQSYATPNKVPGSLILGGYDEARLKMGSSGVVSMPINNTSPVQKLQLNVQQILASGTLDGSGMNLLPDGDITVNVDSATSQLWLPGKVCDLFADAFALTYDNNTDLYLVNNTIHTQLQASPPSVVFTVGGSSGSSGTTNIVLNYNAFDLEVGVPIYNASTPYFPIRRAANESQYTLGRTFLQEAYIIVDWERSNFTIGQTNPQNDTMNVVPLLPPSLSTSTPIASHTGTASSTPDHSSKTFPTGAIAGVVVVVIALVAIGVGVFLCLRRRRLRRDREENQQKHGSVESAAPEYVSGVVENYPPEKTEEKYGYGANVDVMEVDDKRPVMHERKESELSDTQVYELEQAQIDRQLMSTPVDRELMSTPIMELEGSPYIASELDVGYGRTDDPTPPETGAAMRLSMSPVTPRLIDETIRSPRRFTLEDAPYEDEPEDVRRERVVSDVSDSRSDCKSPDFSDFGSERAVSPPPLLGDLVEPKDVRDRKDDQDNLPTPD